MQKLNGLMEKRVMNGAKKILVVDDSQPVASIITYLLTQIGMKVQTAWNATKAIQLAKDETFDLVFLDVNMPGMDGFDLYERLRQFPSLEKTPMIFISGVASDENREKASELGAVDFIEKPFSPAEFVERTLAHLTAQEQTWECTTAA